MNTMGSFEWRGPHPLHDRIEQLEAENRALKANADRWFYELRDEGHTHLSNGYPVRVADLLKQPASSGIGWPGSSIGE
jgi:hypothetical protein